MIVTSDDLLTLARAAVSEFLLDVRHKRPMLVAFSGLRGDAPVPHYEFVGLTQSLDVSTFFIRDLQEAWYRNGVRGLGESLPEVAATVAKIARGAEATRVVFVGASAGGFAAIVAGVLAGGDEIHAFCPQTDLRLLHRWLARDFRWTNRLVRRRWAGRRGANHENLLTFLCGQRHHCEIFLHVGRLELDQRAARRLSRLPGVTVISYGAPGHRFARALREDGTLETILKSALQIG